MGSAPGRGIACGVFGLEALGGLGGVNVPGQFLGSLALCAYAVLAGLVLYSLSKAPVGIRLSDEQQRRGADLPIHSIRANPEGDLQG